MLDELRAELLDRVERDQAARTSDSLDLEIMRAVDADNVAWLARVVAEHGWPGRSLVGDDGAHAAWLLAQHADADPAFQRTCLDLLAAAADAGEATRPQLAYLTDRVLLAEGQEQVYGTQTEPSGGRYAPGRLRDPDSVDERRAAVSLGPIAEYVEQVNASFGPPQAQMACDQCGALVSFPLPGDGAEQQVTCAQCGHAVTLRFPPED